MTEQQSVKHVPLSVNAVNFDFSRATPGIGDLMRRLYTMRVECGDIIDDKVKEQIDANKLRIMKSMDPFEKQKVIIMQGLDNVVGMIKQRHEDPENKRLVNNIRKQMQSIDDEYLKLEKLQQNVKKSAGIWAKVSIDPAIAEARENDVSNIRKHIEQAKLSNKSASLHLKTTSSPKRKNQAKFDSIDNLPDNHIEELPTIDISAGLAQIDENKKKINKLLDEIESQVDQMGSLAKGFKEELQTQSTMLNKIEKDVDVYNEYFEKLNGGLNGKLSKAVEANCSVVRLVFLLIGIMVCLAIVGIVYVAVNNILRN